MGQRQGYGARALRTAVNVLWNVARYRLANREMANLAASLVIMIALRLGTLDISIRLFFGLLLNLAVYLANDYYDIDADLQASNKNRSNAAMLRTERPTVIGILVGLTVVMTAIGLAWSPGLVIAMAGGQGLCWAYSARLKRVAFWDIATITLCGVCASMVAFPLDRLMGWALAGLLGLYAANFQLIQELRDCRDDATFGTKTTAVRLGSRATYAVHRALTLLGVVYATLLIDRWFGLVGLAALALPTTKKSAGAYWNNLRLAMGIGWLALIAALVLRGSTHGWIAEVKFDQVLSLLK